MNLILRGILEAKTKQQLEAHMVVMRDELLLLDAMVFMEVQELGLTMIECNFQREIH